MFDITDHAGLFSHMHVFDQCLQAFFIHKIAEVTECGTGDKKEKWGNEDDGHFDPFFPGDEGEIQEKNVTGKRDEGNDQEGILKVKRESLYVFFDGE